MAHEVWFIGLSVNIIYYQNTPTRGSQSRFSGGEWLPNPATVPSERTGLPAARAGCRWPDNQGQVMVMQRIDRRRIERVARIYGSNKAAGAALGITPSSFARLCRRYGIETPYARKRGQWEPAQRAS